MPQIYDMGQTALLPLRRKTCWEFLVRNIRRLRPGLTPQTWVPETSMLTTGPPKLLYNTTVQNWTITCKLTNIRMNGALSRQIPANVTDENIPISLYSSGRSSLDVTCSSVREHDIAIRPGRAKPSISHSWYHFPGNSKHVHTFNTCIMFIGILPFTSSIRFLTKFLYTFLISVIHTSFCVTC
jgi:hypothetical protein